MRIAKIRVNSQKSEKWLFSTHKFTHEGVEARFQINKNNTMNLATLLGDFFLLHFFPEVPEIEAQIKKCIENNQNL